MNKLLLASLMLASGLASGADNLSADKVKSLMIGSTIEGYNEVKGVAYTVYFYPEGRIALVTTKGKRIGSWRIIDDGHFCSLFPTEQELCTLVVPHMEGSYRRIKDDGTPTHTLKSFTAGNINNY